MIKKTAHRTAIVLSLSVMFCSLSWADDINIPGSATIGKDVSIGGNLNVGGTANVGGSLGVGGDLSVGGGITTPTLTAGTIRGNNLFFTDCGGRYLCTPMMCLEKCIGLGLRMATVDEVYAWASQGKNHCKYMWMLNSATMGKVYRGYPMYTNRTKSGCGTLNTGDIPRIEGGGVFNWNEDKTYNCACAGIM